MYRKDRTMKKSVSIVIAMLLLCSIGRAQKADWNNPKLTETFGELRHAVKTWAKAEVLPRMLRWKSELDGAMSTDDLDALNTLRDRAAILEKEKTEYLFVMRKAWKSEDYEALKDARDNMKSLGERRIELAVALKPIAKKYISTLETIGEDAKPVVGQWKEEGRKMFDEWLAKYKSDLGEAAEKLSQFKGRGAWGMGMMGMLSDDMKKKIAVARFMLWNGDDFTEKRDGFFNSQDENGGMKEHSSGNGGQPTLHKLSLGQNYPNPFNPSTTIRFTLPQTEKITLTVRDINGKLVQTLVDREVESGNHSVVFIDNTIPSGTYFFRLEGKNFSETKSMRLVK